MKKNISCMSIVILKNKKVLVLDNGEKVFPKGHLEEGESLIDCAIRELQEEAGIKVTANECLGEIDRFSFYFDGEKSQKYIYVYLFSIDKKQEINVNKEEGFVDGQWYDLDNALKILTHDDAKNSLKKAKLIIQK